MGRPTTFLILSLLLLISTATALPSRPSKTLSSSSSSTSTPSQINSNSVLVALLDSHYTDLSELIEKALLLPTLELALSRHNITIFAPSNDALDKQLDPLFRRFLLQPGNVASLQSFILYHVVPGRVDSARLRNGPSQPSHTTLSKDKVVVGSLDLVRPNDIVRPDGVIHGIDRVLIPRSVLEDFNRRGRNLRSLSAVLPEGAPEVDPSTNRRKLSSPSSSSSSSSGPTSASSMTIYEAMSPGPSLAPAPAPGPGGPRHHFDGEAQVKDFIHTLLHYGGYNELADILVNLTSLATEMGKLVSEGYVITVLAPNDEAMAKLSTDQLSEPGAPEQIVYYHIIPEYQTEESMYNAVRRFGKVSYDTLRLPYKLTAEEADGSVQFGSGDSWAYLFDPDIYTDGRISVQGIDGVLFPIEDNNKDDVKDSPLPSKVAPKSRRGKLLETTCWVLGSMGRRIC